MDRSIDAAARAQFEADIQTYKCANFSAVQSIYRALPLSAHRAEFLSGKRGRRDGKRAALFIQTEKLRNAQRRVLAFHLACGLAGYNSTVVTEEAAAAGVRRSVEGLCSERTYREALRMLCALGWLTKKKIPTGTKVIVGQSLNGQPVWKSLRVNKVSLTFAARSLIAKHALSHISIPRQKLPVTREEESQQASKPVELSDIKCNFQNQADTDVDTSKGKGAEDKSTRPRSQARSTVEHSPPTSRGRQTAAQKALKRDALRFARRRRSDVPKTWRLARRLLLHDLYAAAHSDNLVDEMHRIAELQTDRRYPPLCISALDWDQWLPKWLELSWKERRRILRDHILPELNAFCAHLSPPNVQPLESCEVSAREKAKIEAQLAAYRRMNAILTSIPKKFFFEEKDCNISCYENSPAGAPELFVLERIPWLLNSGKLFLDNIKESEFEIFRTAADRLGVD